MRREGKCINTALLVVALLRLLIPCSFYWDIARGGDGLLAVRGYNDGWHSVDSFRLFLAAAQCIILIQLLLLR